MTEKFGRSPVVWDEIVTECVGILEDTARDQHLISYSDLAEQISDRLDLSHPVDHHLELSHVLYDAVLRGFEQWPDAGSAPLLSAIAVYKDTHEPGPGHITLAKDLGRNPGPSPEAHLRFWAQEVRELHQHYGEH